MEKLLAILLICAIPPAPQTTKVMSGHGSVSITTRITSGTSTTNSATVSAQIIKDGPGNAKAYRKKADTYAKFSVNMLTSTNLSDWTEEAVEVKVEAKEGHKFFRLKDG